MQDGIMVMRPVDDGLAIPPETIVTFAPGGNHLMFVGLNAPFGEGEHIAVTLAFEKAGKVDATFDVGSVGAKGPRLLMASTDAAPAMPAAAPNDDFFTHLCGTSVMANVTQPRGRGRYPCSA
jgi:periplasmic copper chaperone A